MTHKERIRKVRRSNFGCVFWAWLFGMQVMRIDPERLIFVPLAILSLAMVVACTSGHDYYLRQTERPDEE